MSWNSKIIELISLHAEGDKEAYQKFFKSAMDKFNIKSDFAIDGQDAILKCKQKHYDLIFMDCIMPILDGFEVGLDLHLLSLTSNLRHY